MGRRRIAHAVVLCEDQEHRSFALRYLEIRFGLGVRQIRVNMSPPAAGSAEQYVRRQFAAELHTYRRRANAVATCLLVLTDADVRAVETRVQELEEAQPREQLDRVALFVPRRNVETWAYSFAEADANEEDDYSPQSPDRIREAAVKLAERAASELPSVLAALKEAKRLDRFGS